MAVLMYTAVNKLTLRVDEKTDSELLIELAEQMLIKARELAEAKLGDPARGKPPLIEKIVIVRSEAAE